MTDIPRYRPVANDKYGITDDVDGKLCEYRDYARLKAEVETLKEAWVDKKMQEDRDALLLEVERLRKAGDAMVDYIERTETSAYDIEPDGGDKIADWNAAKEGKPSV